MSSSATRTLYVLLSKLGPHFFSTSRSPHIPFLCMALCACMPPLPSSSSQLERDSLSRLPEHYTLTTVLHLYASHRHCHRVCHTPVFVNSKSSNSAFPILQMRKRRHHKVAWLRQGHPAVKDQEAWLSSLLSLQLCHFIGLRLFP